MICKSSMVDVSMSQDQATRCAGSLRHEELFAIMAGISILTWKVPVGSADMDEGVAIGVASIYCVVVSVITRG